MPPLPPGAGWSFRPRILPGTLCRGLGVPEPAAALPEGCCAQRARSLSVRARDRPPPELGARFLRSAPQPELPVPGWPSFLRPQGSAQALRCGVFRSRRPLSAPGPGGISGNVEPFCFLATWMKAGCRVSKPAEVPARARLLQSVTCAAFKFPLLFRILVHPFQIQGLLSNLPFNPASQTTLDNILFRLKFSTC